MIKQLKAAAAIAILACTGATAVRAQEVTPAEKDRAIQYLEKTKQGVIDATKGLSARHGISRPDRIAGPSRSASSTSPLRKTTFAEWWWKK